MNWVRSKYGFQVLPRRGGALPDWFSSVPNTLGTPADWVADQQGGGWGAVDVAYSAGPYALGPDQALVMEGRIPRGVFSNVVLWNEMGRTEDYRDRTVSLNARQLVLDSQRRFRITISTVWTTVFNGSIGVHGPQPLLHLAPILTRTFSPTRSNIGPAQTQRMRCRFSSRF